MSAGPRPPRDRPRAIGPGRAGLLAAALLAVVAAAPSGAQEEAAAAPDPVATAQDSAPTGAAQDSAPTGVAPAAGPAPNRSGLSDAELDDLTARVAAQLRCPVCRNQSVLESSAELSREMQALIREKLAAGESREQVKAYFVRSYGEWILLQPEPEGVNLLVYVLPALVLVGGIGMVGWLIVRWTRNRAPAAEAVAASELSSGVERREAAIGIPARPEGSRAAEGDRGAEGGRGADGGRDGLELSDEDRSWLEDAVRRG